MRFCFSSATAATSVNRQQFTLLDVKTRIGLDFPFVKTTATERFPTMLFAELGFFKG